MTEIERVIRAFQLEQAMSDRLCFESLHHFTKKLWDVIEPGNPFVDGEHIKAICLHLEAVTEFKIKNLLINIPPRHMKSIIVSVMWPAWVWLKHPDRRFVFSSYSNTLAVQDSVKCRNIIQSDLYQRLIGGAWSLEADMNLKTSFHTTEKGARFTTSVGGTTTGMGGDYLVGDDLLNAIDANSEPARNEAGSFWFESMSSRANNPDKVGKVVIMQRLHEDDPAGRIIKKGNYDLLVLPAQYNPNAKIKIKSSLGFKDWRTKDGELLWPERFSLEALKELRTDLGSAASSGQLDQDPKPAGGGTFKRTWWKFHKLNPLNIIEMVQFWDCAQKDEDDNDFSVCATWAKTPQGFFLLDLWRKKVQAPELQRTVVALYNKHKPDAVVIEDKSSGSSLIQYLLLDTALPVLPYDPGQVSKFVRANAATPSVEAGRCSLNDKLEDLESFIDEHEKFPKGANDDTVDTTSMMIEYFTKRGTTKPGVRTL